MRALCSMDMAQSTLRLPAVTAGRNSRMQSSQRSRHRSIPSPPKRTRSLRPRSPTCRARARARGCAGCSSPALSFALRSHGTGKGDRFTKLKGVLVNNLLKEYHKQTRQQGDQVVYNHAVMEVEKILAHNTRLTEHQLQELQRNFAKGVMINVPNRNIHVVGPASSKKSYSAKAAKTLAMSRSIGSQGATSSLQLDPGESVVPPKSQEVQTEGVDAHRASPTHTVADSVAETTTSNVDGGQSKRQRRVDEWSILVLHSDVKHLEEQKVMKEKLAIEKKKTREELQRQMLRKEELKKQKKQEVLEMARMQEEKYLQWKAEQERVFQMKQAKILAEKEYEAKELQRVQKVKQVQAEKDFKEQQAMLAEFQRQIDEEKKAKEMEMQAKAAAYQEMLKGNAKELERKKALKEAERADNQRLFELQIAMAEKQERYRQQLEGERQMRLKKAERMAGELGSRAAEMEAELDARVKKAQEEHRMRDQEREREKRSKKKQRDDETAAVLAEQVQQRNKLREADRADREVVAKQYRTDAEALLQAEAAARKARVERKKAVHADLSKQLALKAGRGDQFTGMSTTELRLNKNLLQKVLEEKTPDECIPDHILEKIHHSPTPNPGRRSLSRPACSCISRPLCFIFVRITRLRAIRIDY